MKDNDCAAMTNSFTDTANPDDDREAAAKVLESGERRQAARRSNVERRDPHSVRAGNPDRRNPDRREPDRRVSDKDSAQKEQEQE